MKALYYKRGDTWRLHITVTDSDGEPIDLTGCAFEMAIVDRDGTEQLRLSDSTGEITTDPEMGLIQFEVVATVTADLSPDTYLTDLQITWSDGSQTSSETLSLVVIPDVTR
jgi:hypothetical protein